MGGSQEYVPGVCNIGAAETQMRWIAGWTGLAITLALATLLIAYRADPRWRLLVFLPAFIGALGFIQAKWHFCAAYGVTGVFNVSASTGHQDTVEQAESREKDRRTAFFIIGLSALSAIVVTAVVYVIRV
ncbi:hypothetical protein [Planctomicrobium piriforme]|uniref:Uncharacterized protein n=1 Tax=Planctomicrobium piriforme TaxID=1576369 RepID=A0A1I3B8B2_9PLAN|nr:hypothetical protein [Planctomicrobium piriforme]SFH57951.1 hypothetical protein SAMN05421753_101270 [Planctomicrobium piriforme]